MHIRSFHIDGFGIFADVDVPALSSGLNIFLGENESGKSTCLDFFRVMLCGYPHPNSRELPRPPLKGGQAGGFLLMETLRHGIVRLTRRPGPGGGIKLNDQDGRILDPALLETIMAGVTREVYRNVFAFSLSELQTLRTLSTPEVRNALYGASFGMGLRSPAAILKQLDEHLGKIFAPQGRKLRMNTALAQLDEVRGALRAAQEKSAQFDVLAVQRGETEESLRVLREEQTTRRLERRLLERRLGVWRQWEEWRQAGMALERLHPVPETFPTDGPARLDRAKERREAAARHLHALEERIARLRAERDSLVSDEKLLALSHELAPLTERKGSYRNALSALPTQHTALERSREALARLLGSLGPDWTCERIRAANRSLFAREELERQAREMDVADQSCNASAMHLQRANSEVESARHEVEVAKLKRERLPAPEVTLNEEGRERLRYIFSRLEETRQRSPERMQALHAARSEAARRYAPLRLKADAPDNVLELLVNAQEGAQERADAVQGCITVATEAKQAAEQAQRAEEAARAQLDRLRARLRDKQGPTRGFVDDRSASLRALRQLNADLAQEIARLAELDERMQRPAPTPLKSPLLLIAGVLLMAAGFGLLIARWQFGLKALPFSPDFTFPVTLWSGYLVVVAGVAFLAGGLPRSGPEFRQYKDEAAQLRERRDGTVRRITELEKQAHALCANIGIGDVELSALDAVEVQLNQERERLMAEERLNQELGELQAGYAQTKEYARRLDSDGAQAENAVQHARRGWHEYLLGYYVESVPSPEAAGAFFARVEAARLARANALALEKELQDMTEQSNALECEARAMPSVTAFLPQEDSDPDALMLAARRALDACREADACAGERLKAAAALLNAESNLKRAESTQEESSKTLHAAEKRLETARAAWRGHIATLGLGAELSPGTVREALECMERCLNAETETAGLQDGIARLETERDALLNPLKRLLDRLGREPLPGADGLPDWLAALDMLLRDVQSAEHSAEERTRMEQRVTEEEVAARAAQTALDDEQRAEAELLALAQVDNAEDFLRHAAAKAAREELVRRRQDLEDALRLAAGNTPFDEFTASFAEFDRQERERFLADLDAQLENQERKERVLVDTLGELGSRRKALDAAVEELAELRHKEKALLESLRQMMLEYGRHALARQLIKTAKQNFERQSQPAVIRAASSIFTAITDGAWIGMNASLDDSSLSLRPQHGESVSPEHLSRGAQEQLYLALRLAYICNHAGRAAALPMIMDDILVNFDPPRASRTARALETLVRGLLPQNGQDAIPPHQVLFFTCHPHLAEMLQHTVQGSVVYRVGGGSISSAGAL